MGVVASTLLGTLHYGNTFLVTPNTMLPGLQTDNDMVASLRHQPISWLRVLCKHLLCCGELGTILQVILLRARSNHVYFFELKFIHQSIFCS